MISKDLVKSCSNATSHLVEIQMMLTRLTNKQSVDLIHDRKAGKMSDEQKLINKASTAIMINAVGMEHKLQFVYCQVNYRKLPQHWC